MDNYSQYICTLFLAELWDDLNDNYPDVIDKEAMYEIWHRLQ